MNATKPIAFAAAMLITAASLYGIATYTSAATGTSRQPIQATADNIQTLPAIVVRPTAEQMRQLRGIHGSKADPAAAAASGALMPYYSFASEEAGA